MRSLAVALLHSYMYGNFCLYLAYLVFLLSMFNDGTLDWLFHVDVNFAT